MFMLFPTPPSILSGPTQLPLPTKLGRLAEPHSDHLKEGTVNPEDFSGKKKKKAKLLVEDW